MTYDYAGKVISLTAANPGGLVTTSYTYGTKRGLLTGETVSSPTIPVHSLAYGYDANGNLSQLMYPGGHVVTYAPDALGRATQITGTGGEIYASGISYHPGGAIAGFTYGNDVVHAMTQNARKLPAHSTDTFGRFAVLDDTYVFDANGNVDYMADAAGTGNQNRTKDLGYDDLDRLIVADAPNQWITATYAYDPLDNLRIADQGTRQYRYNYNATTNLLTDIKTPAGATVFGFTYDARGNTTAKGAQGYTFDVANRMNAVNSVQEYLYDGQGRRVRTGNLADGKRTTWIYSQAGQVMYTDEEPTNKQLFYVYLGNTQVAVRSYDKLTLTATVKYQHTDSLGSPVAETIASPTSTNTVRHSYAPYGEAYGEPMGGSVSGTGYTGHVMDRATNLTYMQQRYYDPQSGRFLSNDPVSADPNRGASFNRYNYANNNPYRFTDPDGRLAGDGICDSGVGGCNRVWGSSSSSSTEDKIGAALAKDWGNFRHIASAGDGGGGGGSSSWSDSGMMNHYMTGGGRGVTLSEMGLANQVYYSETTQGALKRFGGMILDKAQIAIVDVPNGGSVAVSEWFRRGNYDMKSVRWSFGGVQLSGKFEGRAYRVQGVSFVTGRASISFYDSFHDALDPKNLVPGENFEVPGATPYSITEAWTRSYNIRW